MQLTDRDREIVRQVFRHRFLRSSQIAALAGGSEQAVLRRLQLLYHHGYLERPRAQIEYYQQGGSRPLVYGLADRAAELLRATEGETARVQDWGTKNSAAKRLFIEHALLVSDTMVALEIACRNHGSVRLLYVEDIVLPDNPHTRHRPFGWKVNLNAATKVGLVPDRVFALEFPDRPADRTRAYFFLEADRATMPVVRNHLRQTSFQRKLLAYEATWTQELHRKHFGFHRFRVLTVSTSTERLTNLVKACNQLERGHGLFLFTDASSLAAHTDALSLPWQSVKGGQTYRLIDG
jgi:DNA-binding Lrp family transcriptional regulator